LIKNLAQEIKLQLVEGGITAVSGIKAAGICCGIKTEKPDLALIYSENVAEVAATFTTNEVQAAPVQLCKERHPSGKIQAIIINSGNANACTGEQGKSDARRMTQVTARDLGIEPQLVWVASTGVIGIPLPMTEIELGIGKIIPRLSAEGGADAARAILTTDTCTKQIAVQVPIGDRLITIGAIAKGSGMIRPQMATMLCFIATDAPIKSAALQPALEAAVYNSFNCISVDGDTSTNDMVLLLANGRAGGEFLEPNDPKWPAFCQALDYVTLEMAKAIVRDGEGATKLIEIRVEGAQTEEQAKLVAFTIADSPLVKTAFFGQQVNWGRIMAAAGKAGTKIKPELIDIYIGLIKLVENGYGLEGEMKKWAEEKLKEKEISLTIDLNLGDAHAQIWTTDLSYDYVRINADYHNLPE
jgi:glutamate N-acetyltransferase/amino-acid N-acetyltransferase